MKIDIEYPMSIEKFRELLRKCKYIDKDSDLFIMFHKLAQSALKITMELNNKYHTPDEIVELFTELTGHTVPKSFRLFPPFCTDCGKNMKIGENVFINACCGAGSTVTKNIPQNTIVAGNPAKIIKKIDVNFDK